MRWQNQDQNPGLQTLSTEAQSSLWVPGGPESSLVSDTHGTKGREAGLKNQRWEMW